MRKLTVAALATLLIIATTFAAAGVTKPTGVAPALDGEPFFFDIFAVETQLLDDLGYVPDDVVVLRGVRMPDTKLRDLSEAEETPFYTNPISGSSTLAFPGQPAFSELIVITHLRILSEYPSSALYVPLTSLIDLAFVELGHEPARVAIITKDNWPTATTLLDADIEAVLLTAPAAAFTQVPEARIVGFDDSICVVEYQKCSEGPRNYQKCDDDPRDYQKCGRWLEDMFDAGIPVVTLD